MYKLSAAIFIAFFGFILWIIYLANTGQRSIFFDWVAAIPHGDKIGHVVLFGTLTLLANLSCRFGALNLARIRLPNVNLYWGTLAVWAFVTVEEGSQHFVKTRTFDGLDYVADIIGIGLATFLSAWLHRKDPGARLP